MGMFYHLIRLRWASLATTRKNESFSVVAIFGRLNPTALNCRRPKVATTRFIKKQSVAGQYNMVANFEP